MLIAFKVMHYNFIAADEYDIHSGTSKKYTLSVCAIFKNEAENLKDWIDYHHSLGVDHFYLYNTGSRDSFMPILIPYMNEDLVTLVNWPIPAKYDNIDDHLYALSVQVPAYENAVNFLAREETKWLILMDIDEHLVCPNGNLATLLIDYDGVPSIDLSEESYIAALKTQVPFKQVCAQMQESGIFDPQTANQSVTKMIFKPDLCSGFMWPPYHCRLDTEQPGIKADPQELRISHYLNKNRTSYKNKTLSKRDTGNILLSVNSLRDIREKEYPEIYEKEYWEQPMYIYTPDFLKRLIKKER